MDIIIKAKFALIARQKETRHRRKLKFLLVVVEAKRRQKQWVVAIQMWEPRPQSMTDKKRLSEEDQILLQDIAVVEQCSVMTKKQSLQFARRQMV